MAVVVVAVVGLFRAGGVEVRWSGGELSWVRL
jgi:hypothetical protein